MTLAQAEVTAQEWLLRNGVAEHSEAWVAQYKELVRIIWLSTFTEKEA